MFRGNQDPQHIYSLHSYFLVLKNQKPVTHQTPGVTGFLNLTQN